jgi:DNA invertase Pin-like site-specific DNA recombinase
LIGGEIGFDALAISDFLSGDIDPDDLPRSVFERMPVCDPDTIPIRSVGTLCRDAAQRKFDVVMAWSVDRLGRSLQDLVAFLSELHALRIDLFLHQQGLDTTTPAGKAMFQMMVGVFAEFERSIIAERVRSGIKRVRSEGKRWGRPPIAPALEKRIREALNKPGRTEGIRKIAARFGVDPSTVQRISRPFGDEGASAAA